MANRFFLILGFLCIVLIPGKGFAGVIANHDDWTVIEEREGEAKVCFAVSAPINAEGDYTQRGDIFLLVTHRPREKAIGVVSIQAGYTYKARTDASVRIRAKTFKLFTDGENAWARDTATDQALVAAMKASDKLVVTGTSSRGTQTTDTYSLSGFTKAYRATSKACGVKP